LLEEAVVATAEDGLESGIEHGDTPEECENGPGTGGEP
jgi:hypothetical protein